MDTDFTDAHRFSFPLCSSRELWFAVPREVLGYEQEITVRSNRFTGYPRLVEPSGDSIATEGRGDKGRRYYEPEVHRS